MATATPRPTQRITPAHAAHRVRPTSARCPQARSGHQSLIQARSAGSGWPCGRSAPVAGSTWTTAGPVAVSSTTSSGTLSSHSLAITSPVMPAGGTRSQRIRGSSPAGRGATSTAQAAIRPASPRPASPARPAPAGHARPGQPPSGHARPGPAQALPPRPGPAPAVRPGRRRRPPGRSAPASQAPRPPRAAVPARPRHSLARRGPRCGSDEPEAHPWRRTRQGRRAQPAWPAARSSTHRRL